MDTHAEVNSEMNLVMNDRFVLQSYMIPDYVIPLLVLVNVKSGGQQGQELITSFRKLLNPHQVFDLMNGGPLPGSVVLGTRWRWLFFHILFIISSRREQFRSAKCSGTNITVKGHHFVRDRCSAQRSLGEDFWAERGEVGAALWSHVCVVVVMEDPPPPLADPLAG